MGFIEEHGLIKYNPKKKYPHELRWGACEVCGITSEELPARYSLEEGCTAEWASRLVFDHCHVHGWIRGRLCVGCNTNMTFAVQVGGLWGPDYNHEKADAYRAHLMKCPDCTEDTAA